MWRAFGTWYRLSPTNYVNSDYAIPDDQFLRWAFRPRAWLPRDLINSFAFVLAGPHILSCFMILQHGLQGFNCFAAAACAWRAIRCLF